MKKNLGYLAASFLGSLIAIAVMLKIDINDDKKQLEIERLRAQHQSTNQQVSYSLPSQAVDFTDAAQLTVDAVVHVKTTFELDGGYYTFDPIRHFFFGDGFVFDRTFWSWLARYIHVIVAIMWIGLLWYFNFVQIPNMAKIAVKAAGITFVILGRPQIITIAVTTRPINI